MAHTGEQVELVGGLEHSPDGISETLTWSRLGAWCKDWVIDPIVNLSKIEGPAPEQETHPNFYDKAAYALGLTSTLRRN